MEEYKLFYELRHKQNKTQTEELLLNYRKTLAVIGEILVDESKVHISSEKAINQIREYMNKNM
jgi:hypothetical protein